MKPGSLIMFGMLCTLFCTTFFACHKKIEDSLSGRDILAGRFVFSDTLYYLNEFPTGKEAEVHLFPENPATGFLYKKKTEDGGYFLLDFLDERTKYRVTARLVTDNADYIVDSIFTPSEFIHSQTAFSSITYVRDSVRFILRPDYTKYDYLYVRTVDAATQEILTGADVCFFSSLVQFKTMDCSQAAFKTTTNAKGDSILKNATPGKYYVLARKIVGKDTLMATLTDYVITKGRFQKLTLQLRK